MSSRITTDVLYIAIGGHESDERAVELHYEHDPETGDGWNEPRILEGVSLQAAFVGGMDIYPLLSADLIARIEADLLEMIRDEKCAEAEEAADRRRDELREWA